MLVGANILSPAYSLGDEPLVGHTTFIGAQRLFSGLLMTPTTCGPSSPTASSTTLPCCGT